MNLPSGCGGRQTRLINPPSVSFGHTQAVFLRLALSTALEFRRQDGGCSGNEPQALLPWHALSSKPPENGAESMGTSRPCSTPRLASARWEDDAGLSSFRGPGCWPLSSTPLTSSSSSSPERNPSSTLSKCMSRSVCVEDKFSNLLFLSNFKH